MNIATSLRDLPTNPRFIPPSIPTGIDLLITTSSSSLNNNNDNNNNSNNNDNNNHRQENDDNNNNNGDLPDFTDPFQERESTPEQLKMALLLIGIPIITFGLLRTLTTSTFWNNLWANDDDEEQEREAKALLRLKDQEIAAKRRSMGGSGGLSFED